MSTHAQEALIATVFKNKSFKVACKFK